MRPCELFRWGHLRILKMSMSLQHHLVPRSKNAWG
jgi:hypothetical protein